MKLTRNIDSLVLALDLTMPATRKMLEAKGLTPFQAELGLRCSFGPLGAQVGTALFVPEELVAELADMTEFSSFALRNLWDRLFGELRFHGHTDLYLFIVSDENPDSSKLPDKLVYELERDPEYAVKKVCSLTELALRVTNPFAVLTGPDRANISPQFTVLRSQGERVSHDRPVTHLLHPSTAAGVPFADGLCKEPQSAQANLAVQLYARIMGRGYELSLTTRGARLAYEPLDVGSPLGLVSSWERAGFELACFLAKVSTEVTPGMRLGVHCILEPLDVSKLVAALDLLRQFMASTGASIEIESANTHVQNMARSKFKFLAPAQASPQSWA